MNQPIDPAARGFQFPGVFEVSAMGAADAGLDVLIVDILRGAGLRVIDGSQRMRPSRAGNYVSVTVAFEASCRADYDCAHSSLRACAAVKWTL